MAESTPESLNDPPPASPGDLPSQPQPSPDRPSKKPRQRKQADTKPPSPDPPTQPPVHHAPLVQPYPGHPHPYYMNPPYPGHPYQHPSYPHHPPPSQSSHSSSVPPPPPSYGYPMPPGPHHGYYHPTYQYPPPPMMMYGAPPPHPSATHPSPHHPPEQQPGTPTSPPAQDQPGSTASTAAGQKRKRKANKEEKTEQEETAVAAATPAASSTSATQALDLKKRTKTQRACDSCRTRKIRCDIIADTDPPVCQHCKQYNFECSFFLPITETRFKKKYKQEAEGAEKVESARTTTVPSFPDGKQETVLGPTSTAHILHSQATISSRHYEGYDARYNHTFQVSKNGDGIIQVQRSEQPMAVPKPIDLRVEHDMLQQLVNAYFSEVAPLLPVITKAEFLNHAAPPPILLYSMCLVTAARREVPQQVFDVIRHMVDTIIKTEDILSNASIVNVQALLILCMTGDCHSQFVPSALSALWVRLGAAIRMAQDLGLHRCESLKQPDMDLRRRLWGLCVISDRWMSFTYGHPYMISLEDCDARLPSSGNPTDNYIDELARLSILLGRVQKALYTPSGLKQTTDATLEGILKDLKAWRQNLPGDLKFQGPNTPTLAGLCSTIIAIVINTYYLGMEGLLNLLYVCVIKMFFRLFMRISYSLPPHISFGLTVEGWTGLVIDGNQAIDWLDANERVYDVWLAVAYAAVSCGLIQYHTYVRRKSPEAEAKLRKLRDCVARWEKSISPDHMSARRKTAEIITLLYEALHSPMSLEKPALNPTGGVKGKDPLNLDYKPDPSRPGGGVFVARGRTSKHDLKDIPKGMVIGGTSDDEESEVVSTQLGGTGSSATSPSMVNFSPLVAGGNLNPAMNGETSPNNQVINLLGHSQANSSTIQEFAMADNGYLEGLPNGMFEWGEEVSTFATVWFEIYESSAEQWESFFSKFPNQPGQTQQ
ncbi:hypothetical protein E1B28_008959 [Marasmius oreades]|uniref:Zn(2)-C6 fungal-type domain-containing protein n=1 Tax=Marasmius oreades TaxID=181124 RepID=A0A9P7S0P7_9AGAR|nr:uncharacterized protein E1B28_008959 [Marasmius oreades]KAG7092616.1 hypothetical protein E1B28_008959 [Marasmius oreades]